MQRLPALRPLSRQHHLGLNLGLKASQCKDNISQDEIIQQWQMLADYINDELTSHFATEETYLVHPLITEHSDKAEVKALSEKLLNQHQELHNLLNNSNPKFEDLRHLGRVLYDHIRFEERQVFPIAQALLTTEQLNAIYYHSAPEVK